MVKFLFRREKWGRRCGEESEVEEESGVEEESFASLRSSPAYSDCSTHPGGTPQESFRCGIGGTVRYNPSEVYVIPRRPSAQAQAPVVSSTQHTGGRSTTASVNRTDGWVSSYGRAYGEILGLTALHVLRNLCLGYPSPQRVRWVGCFRQLASISIRARCV